MHYKTLYALIIMSFSHFLCVAKSTLHYVPNQGQFDETVHFQATTGEGLVSLKTSSIHFQLIDAQTLHDNVALGKEHAEHNVHSWSMRFIGCNEVAPQAVDSVHTKYHYFRGKESEKWLTDVRASAKVIYTNLYDGIDLLVYSLNGNFKYEFKLHAGADPSLIQWHYTGITPLLTDTGELTFSTTWKTYTEQAPVSYQLINGQYVKVSSKFSSQNNGFSYDVGSFDPSEPLVIDPELVFSTDSHISFQLASYAHPEYGTFVSDLWGSIYSATEGAYTSGNPSGSANITKITPNGDELEWIINIGGGGGISRVLDLEVKDNQLYLFLINSATNYPTTAGVYDESLPGGSAIAITVLNLEGNELIKSTLFRFTSSSGRIPYYSLAPLDPNIIENLIISHAFVDGNIILAYNDREYHHLASGKELTVLEEGFEHQPYTLTGSSSNYNYCMAVASITEDLSTLNYMHLINSDPEAEEAIFIDPYGRHANDDFVTDMVSLDNGTVAISGFSRLSSMPTTPETFQPEWGEDVTDTLAQDGWLAVLDAATGSILHASYLGGSGPDEIQAIRKGMDGDIVVLGKTLSPELETTPGALNMGTAQVFVARISPDLSTINHLARIGNMNDTLQDIYPMGLSVDSCDRVMVSIQLGMLEIFNGPMNAFPLTENAIDTFGNTYFSLLSSDLSGFHYASLYGGGSSHSTKARNYTNDIYYHITCGHYTAGETNYITTTNEVAYDGFVFGSWSTSNISAFEFSSEALINEGFTYDILNPCPPIEVEFTALGSNESYIWNFPDETVETPEPDITREFTEAGIYPVELVITKAETCNYRDTVTVMVDIPQEFSELEADLLMGDITLCELPTTVMAELEGQSITDLTWTLPDETTLIDDTQVSFNIAEPGTYSLEVLVEDNSGCDSSAVITTDFTIYEPLTASWETTSSEPDFCQGAEVQAQFTGSGESALQWFVNGEPVSEGLSFTDVFAQNGTTVLSLLAQSDVCDAEELLTEEFELETSTITPEQVTLPNVFTPNGDLWNQFFEIVLEPILTEDFKSFNLQIMNRWGAVVYESTNPNFKWNSTSQSGEPLPNGVYFYNCTFELNCGDQSTHTLNGSVTILE